MRAQERARERNPRACGHCHVSRAVSQSFVSAIATSSQQSPQSQQQASSHRGRRVASAYMYRTRERKLAPAARARHRLVPFGCGSDPSSCALFVAPTGSFFYHWGWSQHDAWLAERRTGGTSCADRSSRHRCSRQLSRHFWSRRLRRIFFMWLFQCSAFGFVKRNCSSSSEIASAMFTSEPSTVRM